MRIRFIRILALGLAVQLCSSHLWAELELGFVSENKLRSFSGYFEPYLKYDPPYFPNDEGKKKILNEAKDIHAWIENEKNWPKESKINGRMLIEASKLYSYFAHAKIEGSIEKSADYAKAAVDKDPDTFEIQLHAASVLNEAGEEYAVDAARAAEKALVLNQAEAESQNTHYIAATALYWAGYFEEAYHHLKKQMDIDPLYENTADLHYVFNSRVERWGRIPKRVAFETNRRGQKVPEPVAEEDEN